MRLYTTFSPSHRSLYEDYLLETLPPGFEVVAVEEAEQTCPAASYYSRGWGEACRGKMDLFVRACEENMGGVFFYCDVDVQFFGVGLMSALLDELGEYDIACQDDIDEYNSGVFVCRGNERTLAMFKAARENYRDDDQKTLNRHIGTCRCRRLSNRFFTTGVLFGEWTGQTDFRVPSDIVAHHANWVRGVDNKRRVLDLVRSKHESQDSMLGLFSGHRPSPSYPPYPPYHSGPYLEDYFIGRYYAGGPAAGRDLIPVSWTTCYVEGRADGLQEALDALDPSGSYFVVAQHDDAVRERLPPDTVRFCAGGNTGGVPIPLVCSPIPKEDIRRLSCPRDLLCSFRGSVTHPIRERVMREFAGKDGSLVEAKRWSSSVSREDYEAYVRSALRSRFLLCPRGYGPNSFRVCEALQLGCVPVVMSDVEFLPWGDELDWDAFAVVASSPEGMYERLKGATEESVSGMLREGQRLYRDYFTLPGVYSQIMKRL